MAMQTNIEHLGRLFFNKPDQKVSITPEHPEPKTEAEEDEEPHSAPAGEDEEALSAPAGASPAAQPPSLLAESPPRMAPEDRAGEHKKDTNSGQVTTEENDSLHKRETHESDDTPYTITDQKGSKTSLHEQPLTLSEGETNPSDSDDNNKGDSVGDQEGAGQQQDLYSDTSQQTQGPTPTPPDNNTTLQESPHTARSRPDGEEELKPSRDSDEGAGQSDKGESETVGCDPGEEQPGSESCSEDEG